jgi:hypothetical protein
MKFSTVTGASLILAAVINGASADQSYVYCKRDLAPCPIKGIEAKCPRLTDSEEDAFGPQDCRSDTKEQLCTICHIASDDFKSRLTDWCTREDGEIVSSQEKPKFEPFCED